MRCKAPHEVRHDPVPQQQLQQLLTNLHLQHSHSEWVTQQAFWKKHPQQCFNSNADHQEGPECRSGVSS